MTWTATEREAEVIGGRAIDIRDDNGDLFCCVYAVLDHSAAIEQMRARARLIVQAEAMRDALAGLKWKSADKDNMEFECRTTYFVLDKIRAIIKATGGEDE